MPPSKPESPLPLGPWAEPAPSPRPRPASSASPPTGRPTPEPLSAAGPQAAFDFNRRPPAPLAAPAPPPALVVAPPPVVALPPVVVAPPPIAAPPPVAAPPEPKIYPVSEIVRQAARTLEARFGDVWIEGEVDSFKRHGPSGHLYFNLKDQSALVCAMMPRARAQRVRFPVADGLKVRARGRLSLYEAQGRFQFYVEELELTGEGELLRAFEELKARLQREGLFDRKRRLPAFPRVVGLATSTSGAALKDVLRVAYRRGKVRFLIANCQVQGDGAPAQICDAIYRLQRRCDVIIVGRGGGAAADLWAFNDEGVARAIFASRVPVVSAVGHEVDYTIADFVADARAPTPSAAAEIVVPEFAVLAAELRDLTQRLSRGGQRTVDTARQRLDIEVARGQQALERLFAARRRTLSSLEQRLTAQHPKARLMRDQAALLALRTRLLTAGRGLIVQRRRSFEGLAGKLDALSPLKVLVRGYAVARDEQGHVITDAAMVPPGQALHVRVAQGELHCRVESVSAAEGHQPAPADPAKSP